MNKHRIFKRIISVITILMLITTSAYAGGSVTTAAVWNGGTASSFAGGSGTASNPYLISTPEQLAYLAALVNNNNTSYNSKNYQLTEDLDLGGREWTPIGKGIYTTNLTSESYAFKGVFNGNGHTVSNFKITSAGTSYLGLFGNLYGGNSASIANLNVSNFTINVTMSGNYNLAAGGIVGTNYGIISSCSASNGSITVNTTGTSNSAAYAGGIVGRNQGGAITKSHSGVNAVTYTTGTSCNSYAGGLIGYITSGNITYSYSTGNAKATSEGATSVAFAGGFAAANQGDITSSYANGSAEVVSMKSTATAAGFVGHNTGTVTTSYATGNTRADSKTKTGHGGGLVGNNKGGSVISCFATGNVNTTTGGDGYKSYAGGLVGLSDGTITTSYRCSTQTLVGNTTGSYGTAYQTAMFQNSTFFTSAAYFTPIWDFITVWNIGVTPGYIYPTLISTPHPATWSGGVASSFAGGSGSASAPYEISNAAQLALLANNVNSGNAYQDKYFKLTSNIDLMGLEWLPIGRGRITIGEENASNAFSGNFDGCNYTISNFKISTANTAYTGLFGIIYGGNVSNVKVSDFTINITSQKDCLAAAGGIAGACTGTISNCCVSGTITGASNNTAAYIGGITGRNNEGIIIGCIANVQVNSTTVAADSCHAFAGGITGYNQCGTISTSYSTGSVTSLSSGAQSASYAGGITAMNTKTSATGAVSAISDSYSNSNIQATSNNSTAIAGGIIAHNIGQIINCYSTGSVNCNSVTKSGYGGGLIGNNAGTAKNSYTISNVTLSAGTNKYVGNLMGTSSGTIEKCYYTTSQTVSPTPTKIYGTSTTVGNLSKPAFYTSTLGWDMTSIWTIGKVEGYSYPTFINSATDTEPEPPVDDDPNIDPDGWDGTTDNKFNGGNGTSSSPYQIATPGQLLYMANRINEGTDADKHYSLTANINLNHRRWTPIGTSATEAFKGSFDGNGYSIENLKINSATNGYAGLFGYVQDGSISNVIINNVKVEFDYSSSDALYTGAVAAYINGNVSECYAQGTIKVTGSQSASQSYFGGIVGYGKSGTISGATSEVIVDATTSGVTNSGGIIGYAECNVNKCGAKSDVISTSGNTNNTGGVIGYFASGNTATDCYSRGKVTGSSLESLAYTGGLAGYNLGSWVTSYSSAKTTANSVDSNCYAGGLFGYSNEVLTSCFAVNDVSAVSKKTAHVGGLFGSYAGGDLHKCYRSTSQKLDAGSGSVNTRGATESPENLQSKAHLTNLTYFKTPWDFDNVWQFKTVTGYLYPIHKNIIGEEAADVWDGSVADSFAGGSGTRAKPYQIANASQLAYLAYLINTGAEYADMYYELTADIDLAESTWVPIGKGISITDKPTSDKAFCGTFDGNGYTIKNMTVNTPDKSGYGLFGNIYNAVITNIKLDNVNIDITAPNSTNIYVGGIAGIAYGSEISYVRTTGTINAVSNGKGNIHAGGLIGANYDGIIQVAYSSANIESTASSNVEKNIAGGITGYNSCGDIIDCYYSGNTIKASATGGSKTYAGGIAGYTDRNSKLTTGYSTSKTTASSSNSRAGGIVGYAEGSAIESMFATGNVTATTAGGIIGLNSESTITKCYKNNQQIITADSTSLEGTNISIDKFKDKTFYSDARFFTTLWDFDSIWEITSSYEYPALIDVPHVSSDSTPGEDTKPTDNSFTIEYSDGLITINAEKSVTNAAIIVTAYNGNTMVNSEIIVQNLGQGENFIIPNTFSSTGADKVKVMIWDSAVSQNQLCIAKEITL